MKKLTDWLKETKKPKKSQYKESEGHKKKVPLKSNLPFSIQEIKKNIGQSPDVIMREVTIGKENQTQIAVNYIDGLVDKQFVHEFILNPLMFSIREADLNEGEDSTASIQELLRKYSLTTGELEIVKDYEKVYDKVLSGDTVVILDGEEKAFSIGTRGWAARGIEEPSTEHLVFKYYL